MEPYVPGPTARDISERYDIEPESLVKLSSNEAPLGPAPEVRVALHAAAESDDLHRYPSPGNSALRRAIGEKLGLMPAHVLPDAGSSSTWPHVIRAFSSPGDEVVVIEPSMMSYAEAAILLERTVARVITDFPFDVKPREVLSACSANTRVVFISSPNNTTSRLVPPEVVEEIAIHLPRGLVVVDEHYIHAADGYQEVSAVRVIDVSPNVLVSQTFSKMYGLAGLRIGFIVGDPYAIEQIAAFRSKWSVSIVAEAAALAALEAEEHLQDNIKATVEGRRYMLSELEALPVEVVQEAQGGFLLFRAREKVAREVNEGLLRQGIIVRDDLLEGWIRVSVGAREENERFITVLRSLLVDGR